MTKDERLSERETILRWDAHKDVVHVYTASPVVDRKIKKAGHQPTRDQTRKGAWSGSFYVIPYKSLRWGVRTPGVRKTGPSRGGFRAKSPSP